MKLFKIFVFWKGLVALIHPVSAQNSEECLQNLSIFAEYAKVKNYSEAYQPWISVRKECPSLNVAIYSYGEKFLKDRIKNATPETRDVEISDLINLYDEWLENFPTKRNISVKGDIISDKAQAMLDYNIADKMEIYKTFDLAYKTDAESLSLIHISEPTRPY